jgi:type I restriction enzyme, S subunit
MDWEVKKLGEVCDFQNGFAFKSKLFTPEGLPILRISNIQQDKISYQRLVFFKKGSYNINFDQYGVNEGDLVIAMSGATTGKIAISDTKETFYLNQRVGKFKPRDGLHNKYLYYFLTTRIEKNLKISQGSAQPNLSTEQIKNFEIPVPPLPIQKKIVAILDKAFERISKAKENAERNLKNAKEVFESYLQNVFENKGGGWEEKTLNEVVEVERGSSPRPIKKYITTKDDGVNWIKIGDTKGVDKYIYKTGQKITPEGALKSRFVDVGDFILSNSMSFGKPYIMKTQGYIHDGWFVFRLPKSIDTEFLWYLLASPFVMDQFIQLSSGAIVKNISGDLVKKTILPIPPIKEQKVMVIKFDSISQETKKLESIYNQKLQDLEELKRSILQKAFKGELT